MAKYCDFDKDFLLELEPAQPITRCMTAEPTGRSSGSERDRLLTMTILIELLRGPLSDAVSVVKHRTQVQPPISDPEPPLATPPATGEEMKRRNG